MQEILRKKVWELLIYNSDYENVPYQDINRPRYSFLKDRVEKEVENLLIVYVENDV